ncbi:MAG TPA: SRPBCC family protein [Nocardioidaceae bacterium]|nr:SRPBCC family protein [Nocardioidaceae bacterium]
MSGVDLNHSFTVPASVADTWRTFEDIESVAGCFPGAVVTEVDGDDFKGTCKVKLGPIAMVYSGSGTFVEKDEAARRFVVDARGKDKRGNGTAGAVVTATFTEESATSTRVDVQTDLAITGKPAQFGRGVIEDVSNKLLQQFVTCLQDRVAVSPAAEEGAAGAPSAVGSQDEPNVEPVGGAGDPGDPLTSDAAAHSALAAGTGVGEAGGTGLSAAAESALVDEPEGRAAAPGPGPGSRTRSEAHPQARSTGSTDDALDLGATVLPVLARVYGPRAAGALLLVVLGYLLGRRR